jgi:EpsI family protein
VFRDGHFFSIPSGDWSVVEECSGVRYLIASVTLGVLYAYLTYTRLWKRLLFVALSIVVPVFANGLRAYMIVMLAHLSDMKLAVGIDHLIYGWVFFGIIITILFLVGSFWRDPPEEPPKPASQMKGGARVPAAALAIAAVAASVMWPAAAWTLRGEAGADQSISVPLPDARGEWRVIDRAVWSWRPHVVAPDGERHDFFARDDGATVSLSLHTYRTQRQDAELLSSQNQMFSKDDTRWTEKEQTQRMIRLGGAEIAVKQSRLSSRSGVQLLVWSWYRIGDHHTANPYLGKLMEAWSLLLAGRRDGSLIAVAAPYADKADDAAATMQDFIETMLPSVEEALEGALAPDS